MILVMIIMICSLIGTVLLIGVCSLISTAIMPPFIPRYAPSSTVLEETFWDDQYFNDKCSCSVSDESTEEDGDNPHEWIVTYSIPTEAGWKTQNVIIYYDENERTM